MVLVAPMQDAAAHCDMHLGMEHISMPLQLCIVQPRPPTFAFLCFLATGFWAGCAACSDDALAEGAGAVSAAQAGTTIKANSNSSIFFMALLPFLWLVEECYLLEEHCTITFYSLNVKD
jgi:hypothetical protein